MAGHETGRGEAGEAVAVRPSSPPFGIYVHVPFCTRRCDYCAFATWADRAHLVPDYVAACQREIDRGTAAGLPPASSVFFGGGTPSLLTPAQIALILGAVPRQPDAEVTIECNPETVDTHKLCGYRDAGVTRLSFGVQSMVPHVLSGARAGAPGGCGPAGRVRRRFGGIRCRV